MKVTNKSMIALLVGSLFANTAYATTDYFSEANLTLEITGFTDQNGVIYDVYSQPADISISAFDNSADNDYSVSIIGDGYVDGVSTPYADSSLIELGTQASGYSGSPYAYAQSDATASAYWAFENTSLLSYSVNMIMSYSYFGEVETDTPTDEQNGRASVDMSLFGDNNFNQNLSLTMVTGLGQSAFSGSSTMAFSFLLEGNETENVYASLFSYGESETVSSVPLPASIFFMFPTMIGLIACRRRA